jgi:TolA-binding protein
MSQLLDDALDLSARARRSEATEADLKRLKLALGSSVTLQVAHRVGTDFDAALSVRASDAELLDEIVAGALGRATGKKMPRATRPRLAVWLAAAAALLVSAGAFGWWQKRLLPSADSDLGPQAVPSTAPARVKAVPPRSSIAPEPSAALDQPTTPTATASSRSGAGDAPPSAQALFARANRARSSQRPQEAIDLYRLLQKSHPGSAEALTSRVALGRLLLAEGEYTAALAEFDRQLAAGGALAEEALLWRARTLQRMGNSTAEQQAFRLLLERYPNSAYEQEARSRLGR